MSPVRARRRALGAAVVLVAGLAGCTAAVPETPGPEPSVTGRSVPAPPDGPATVAAALPPVSCASSLKSGPLPVWARHGFSDDGSGFRHVEGLRGVVVGVVFGYPLTSPPPPSRANKILWVAQNRTAGPLHIDARLDGTGAVVARDVGFGGGQSIIDLPAPGCWRMTLRWGDDVTDVVDVPYTAPRKTPPQRR